MKITTKGYIEVFRGSEYISRHRVETEAIESAFTQGPGDYIFQYPNKELQISGVEASPGSSYWGTNYWAEPGVGVESAFMDIGLNLVISWEAYAIT